MTERAASPFCAHCGTRVEPAVGCPRCALAVAQRVDTSVDEQLGRLAEAYPGHEWLECIGRGGMGVVYRAWHRRLDRQVAVKVLDAELARGPDFQARFEREARTMASLSHPQIVGVHDFGETDGLFVLFLEYVDGTTLRGLACDGPLSVEQTQDVARQMCAALEYAHAQGVIHRDIKPENVLLDERGTVKLTDFGLARIVGSGLHGLSLTRSHQVMGTPHYMAPEQMRAGSKVDARADLFSLGVVLYEMLTGALPVGRFAPPSSHAAIDPAFEAAILRCLEPDPNDRFDSVAEFRSAWTTSTSGAGAAAFAPRRTVTDPRASRGSRWILAGAGIIGAITYAVTWESRGQAPFDPLEPKLGRIALAALLIPVGLVLVEECVRRASELKPAHRVLEAVDRWMNVWVTRVSSVAGVAAALATFGLGERAVGQVDPDYLKVAISASLIVFFASLLAGVRAGAVKAVLSRWPRATAPVAASLQGAALLIVLVGLFAISVGGAMSDEGIGIPQDERWLLGGWWIAGGAMLVAPRLRKRRRFGALLLLVISIAVLGTLAGVRGLHGPIPMIQTGCASGVIGVAVLLLLFAPSTPLEEASTT